MYGCRFYCTVVGTGTWNAKIISKRYLLEHPEELKNYQVLKRNLASKYLDNRNAYRAEKHKHFLSYMSKAYKLYNIKDDESEIEKLKTVHTDYESIRRSKR